MDEAEHNLAIARRYIKARESRTARCTPTSPLPHFLSQQIISQDNYYCYGLR
jgi:hypothetical protein